MTLTVTHTTPADGTFSATGAAAWDATHTLSLTGTSLQVQYNNAGAFGGMSGTSWDDTNRALTVTGATITTSNPVLNLSQTWNAAGVTFTGYKLNVTDTASATASLLADLQVGGVSQFSVRKDGTVNAPSGFIAGVFLDASIGVRIYGLGGGQINIGGGGAGGIYFTPTTNFASVSDLAITRKAAASLRFGAADAAAPVAQTIGVQSVVAGTSNTAGANFTIAGSQNTGSGTAGNIVLSNAFSNTVGTATVTITIAAPAVITWTAHGLVTGSPVVFTTTGALPTGITAGTTYYAITSSTLGVNTFQIATTAILAAAGTAVTTSGTQSGTHTGTTSATVQSPLLPVVTVGPWALTGSQTTPVLNLAQTWNTSGTATGLKLNITNTASAAASLLMDLQVGGSTQFSVSRAGQLVIGSPSWGILTPSPQNGGLGYGGVNNNNAICLSTINGGYNSYLTLNNVGLFGFTSTASAFTVFDTIQSRKSAAWLQHGAADAAAPVAQTIGVQSVIAGTSNKAGENFKIAGSQGTGSGIGGSIIFQTAAANSGGGATVQNTLTDALTIDSVGSIQLVRALTVATLPGTPLAGMIARVSDALAPAIGTTVASGGAAYALVNYNGANWTVIGV